jgi:hypothetical protein
MGEQAIVYRRRKLAEKTGAAHELELYHDPPPWRGGNRPCFCEWSHLQDRLLGNRQRQGFPCACAGQIGMDVPGYPNDEQRMRRFAQEQALETIRRILAPVIDWYRETFDLHERMEAEFDIDAFQAELIRRVSQLPPSDVEELVGRLA